MNSLLMYSPPLSYLSSLVFFSRVFSIKDLKIFKVSNTSDSSSRKQIQQYLEQSSMKVRKYLDPFIDVVALVQKHHCEPGEEQKKTLISFPTPYLRSGCLPTKQPLQTTSEDMMRDNTSTISSLCSCRRYFRFKWKNISCQIMLVLLA